MMDAGDEIEIASGLAEEDIVAEGYLKVKASHGTFSSLKPWLTRYFVLVRSDMTLRRYGTAEEVEAITKATAQGIAPPPPPKGKAPRVYPLGEIENVGTELGGGGKFYLRLKPTCFGYSTTATALAAGVDEEQLLIRLQAETDEQRGSWMDALQELLQELNAETGAIAPATSSVFSIRKGMTSLSLGEITRANSVVESSSQLSAGFGFGLDGGSKASSRPLSIACGKTGLSTDALLFRAAGLAYPDGEEPDDTEEEDEEVADSGLDPEKLRNAPAALSRRGIAGRILASRSVKTVNKNKKEEDGPSSPPVRKPPPPKKKKKTKGGILSNLGAESDTDSEAEAAAAKKKAKEAAAGAETLAE